ncbi:MAG: LarC family nickel insertion protein, partial [Thermoguttaceae bacterium]|nr:LarC family nickel insertion protein [Thermoguttaceae bacterium]
MRWIRFDSVGGASGDMILAALIGLGADVNILKERLESVFSDKFTLRLEEASSHGLHGRRMTVDLHEEHPHQHEEHGHHHHHEHEHDHDHGTEHHHHHEHRCFADIRDLINASPLEEAIKKDAIGIFRLLADAEGTVHQCPPEEVHFHEVGAADSIIDIVGAAIGFHLLGVEAIEVGPVPVGSGTVRCAHGLIPVPAPAVVELLKLGAFPVASDCEPVEMLTPTGAAILSYWPKATWSGSTKILRSAHAFGHRAMAGRPNLLRATLCQCDGDPTSGGGCAAANSSSTPGIAADGNAAAQVIIGSKAEDSSRTQPASAIVVQSDGTIVPASQQATQNNAAEAAPAALPVVPAAAEPTG